jgi:proline iminopeptidase
MLTALEVVSLPTTANAANSTAAESGTIRSGKFALNYWIEGSGIPTIVIGFPNYYRRLFSENLRSHLRLVFVDHRGSARSPGLVDLSEFSFEQLIDDVELVRRRLRLGQVAVIGHSGHTLIALEYAKKYSQHVSHVIMIGAAHSARAETFDAAYENWLQLASPERQAALAANLSSVTAEQLAQLTTSEAFILKYFILKAPMAWYNPYFDPTPLWEGVDVNLQMFNYVWGELFRDIDITVGLEKFDRPVFLALGRYDFTIAPPSSWDLMQNRFQDITLLVFEQSGHTPQYEEPALFDQALLTWMEQYE